MTQDEIIEMARQAGLPEAIIEMTPIAFEAFATLVAEKEREACAELKNILHPMNFGGKETYTTQELLDHMKTSIVDYSNAIRARGQA